MSYSKYSIATCICQELTDMRVQKLMFGVCADTGVREKEMSE